MKVIFAAYYTAPFIPDVTVVIDAIGEYDTASIWVNHEKIWSKQYPWSLGLFYSAITKRIGLKPNEDEYITMGMAAFGKPCVDMTGIFDEYLHTGIPLKKMVFGINQKTLQLLHNYILKRNYKKYL